MRVMLFTALIAAALLFAPLLAEAASKEEQNVLPNGRFETDLSIWSTEGGVAIDTAAPLEGQGSLRLGPGKAAVSQRYPIGGLQIMWFGASLKADPTTAAGCVRARCYDAKGRVLMDLRQAPDPEKIRAVGGAETGLYFKTHAHTAWLVVSIEAETGLLYADKVMLVDYERDRKPDQAPTCDLGAYMQPLWRTRTVTNETVLMLSKGGKPATGTLLFTPTRVLSVRDYSLAITHVEGSDYTGDRFIR